MPRMSGHLGEVALAGDGMEARRGGEWVRYRNVIACGIRPRQAECNSTLRLPAQTNCGKALSLVSFTSPGVDQKTTAASRMYEVTASGGKLLKHDAPETKNLSREGNRNFAGDNAA